MKSPFPGMDPYLERHWLGVHSALVTYAAEQLNRVLPQSLVATQEERLAIGAESDEILNLYMPDLFVSQPAADVSERTDAGVAVLAAPLRLVAAIEPVKERFIRIIEPKTEKVLTVVEFLSPTNKRGLGLKKFRAMRRQILRSRVNFVEIDLVRFGNWRELLKPQHCPAESLTTYRAVTRLPRDPDSAYLYPISLRHPLPSIPIPLRKEDPEVRLDLQPLIDQLYSNGRYERRLDYSKPLNPPLPREDGIWVEQRVRKSD